MNINELTEWMTGWAESLCEQVENMMHDDRDVFDKTTFDVLLASAQEVSELELVLRSGHAEHLWFFFHGEGAK